MTPEGDSNWSPEQDVDTPSSDWRPDDSCPDAIVVSADSSTINDASLGR